MSPRSEPLNLSSPLEVGEEVLVRYPSRTIDPGLSAISEMKKKNDFNLHVQVRPSPCPSVLDFIIGRESSTVIKINSKIHFFFKQYV